MKRFRITLVDDGVLFIAAHRSRGDGSSVLFERVDDKSGQWVVVSDIHRDNIVTLESLTDASQA
ncbi:hypothetical protein [Nonomuraea diastatica]|uniref:Uncharacterized protein n=1 Tax=Nonomuraea diastatica TaxID=1848329 RepID=A0A4R4WSC0_9ACTN|nr:hypothetical protein [Nonomuraea diastatica]TDD20459.1 hypothetical protein E1294_17775 [Nonomuraea diastatica]